MSKPETPIHSVMNEEKQRNKPKITTKISQNSEIRCWVCGKYF